MANDALIWLERIRALPLPPSVKIMNVCGGHERSIAHAGIRSALPNNLELIPGPGCPVCICPEEDVYQAIQLAMDENVLLVAFGDMLRVPTNAPRREPRSLEQAKARGAAVVPIASPQEAADIARQNPRRKVVFFAAGFETTTAPVAAMLAEGAPDNLYVLLSARRTWPAVEMLLDAGAPGFDALIAPGHVATVMGPEEWEFVVSRHRMPTAVAGFEAQSLLAATYSVLRQIIEGKRFLDNCYSGVVRDGGNAMAQQCMDEVMQIVDANWRGIGVIPQSGYALRPDYAAHDARCRFPVLIRSARKRIGEMPAGCDCAQVVLGKIYPNQCRLYGIACTPRKPIGPCMVSDEGACRIWWSAGMRDNKSAVTPARTYHDAKREAHGAAG